MDWMQGIRGTIDYMEHHLLEPVSIEDISHEVGISAFYLQKGFKLMTEYSPSEYMRNRRLYLAGLEVLADKEKVIDLAYKYSYDTPESFTKAFFQISWSIAGRTAKGAASLTCFSSSSNQGEYTRRE